MNMTKGLPCPCCDKTARFQGGTFGGGINTTNIVCDCGFNAWVILQQDDMDYQVSAEPKDRHKANPYKDKTKDQIIIEKHYLSEALNKTNNFSVIRSLQRAIGFIDDILNQERES